METIEYRNPHAYDKANWGGGEWDKEPDKKQWQDEATGLACLIVRSSSSGSLCGYVGVPKGHPFYEKEYDNADVDVHGGLTFAGKCQEVVNECEGICHKAPEGEDDVWWLGFDTAHSGDLAPKINAFRKSKGWPEMMPCSILGADTYKNLEYVTREVENLAKQVKAAA
jgi:hypothetical protein